MRLIHALHKANQKIKELTKENAELHQYLEKAAQLILLYQSANKEVEKQ